MKLRFSVIACFGLFIAAAQAQIRVDSVVNAASYAQPGMPNEGVAQGSFASAFGSGLGRVKTSDEITLPLQTDWGGLTVKITVGGRTTDAWPVYSNGQQVNFIVPSTTAVGDGTVAISYNGQTATAPVKIVARNFGIFSVNSAGSGPGIFTNAQDQPNLLNNSARPGQVLNLWGTGFGGVTGNEGAQPLPGDQQAVPAEVWVGGKPATITYRGRSGCCIGVDQIQFAVPAGVTGCYVPVVVKVGDTISNYTSISIASNGGACSDPDGLSPELIGGAANGGTIRFGTVLLTRSGLSISSPLGNITSSTDTATGGFLQYNYDRLIRSNTGLSVGIQTIGACMVYTFQGDVTSGIPGEITLPAPLDAGGSLTLEGPRGTKQIPKVTGGAYTVSLGGTGLLGGASDPPFLDPGVYTVRGSGGAQVGPFEARLDLATPLAWVDMNSVQTITRSQGVTVNWTGGRGNVLIAGASAITQPRAMGASFTCLERASAGTFTIPPAVLLALPASPASSGLIPTGVLSVGNISDPVRFTATGLDYGVFSAVVTNLKSVTYR